MRLLAPDMIALIFIFFFNDTATTEIYTLSLHDALPISFLETRTDNVGERVNGIHSRLNEAMYYWEDYDQEDLDTPLNYWNACYAGIAQANQALELLSKYPKNDRVKALYGEADRKSVV